MTAAVLSLLSLGLYLVCAEEGRNESLPQPLLFKLPGKEGVQGPVTLRCQCSCLSAIFRLGKLQDSAFRREQGPTGPSSDFTLSPPLPVHVGSYVCTYRLPGSAGWSPPSALLSLPEEPEGHRPPPVQTDTKKIFVAAFSCLCVLLLFPAIFLTYRRTQRGSSEEDSAKRISRLEFLCQEESSDTAEPERTSERQEEDPLEVAVAHQDNMAMPDPLEEPHRSCGPPEGVKVEEGAAWDSGEPDFPKVKEEAG